MDDRTVTTVKHINRNTVVISPAEGWTVTIFNIEKGKFIEAMVTDADGEETIKLSLEGPDEAYGVVVEYNAATNETLVVYVVKRS